MVEQISELKKQYDQLQQTYSSITGGRGLGNIMNDTSNQNYLPDNWKGTYDSIRTGGYSGLTGDAKTIHDQNTVYDICASMTGDQQRACQREVAQAAQDKAYSAGAYDKAKGRLGQIQGLMDKAGSTDDEKAILEVNARLQAENAMIQNEQIKLQMYQMVTENEQKLAAQQRRDLAQQDLAKRGSFSLGTVNIDKPQ
jgi:type IV secretion system protein VirB5